MSRASFSYQKLEQQQDHDETSQRSAVTAALLEAAKVSVLRARAWTRLRRVPVRRRIRVKFGVVRLKRFLRAKKVRMVRSVKGSWEKVVRRVRDSQAHFGDLFAGNYLLLQVNPTPLKIDAGVRNYKGGYCNKDNNNGAGLGFVGDSKNPRYYDLPRVV